MQWILEQFANLSSWLHPWVFQLSLAIVATLLVLFGQRINKAVKAFVQGAHFLIRSLIFILLCTFGYGLLSVILAKALSQAFFMLPHQWLGIVVIVCLITVGIVTERKS